MRKLIRTIMFGACGFILAAASYLGGRSDGISSVLSPAEDDADKEVNDICKEAGIELLSDDDDEVGSDTM